MKKLLIIGWHWPEPNSSAAGSRMLQVLRCFAEQDYAITFASPAVESPHAADLPALGIEAVSIELNHASFDVFVAQLQPTVVMFDRFQMEEQFAWRIEKTCPDALRILDTEDLHTLRHARQQLAKTQAGQVIDAVPKSVLFSDIAMREIAAILRCDLTLIISEAEMALLINTFNVPEGLLLYLPYMLEEKINSSPLFEQRQHFVSIGNFRHPPNWDAVLQLKQTVWPIIRKKLPKAQLHIIGAYPPKKATQLHNEKEGFLVKGWVEDAHAVLSGSRVLLAPLRFGAGLKGKFIDAALCGLPAVSTSVGVEGLFAKAQTVVACDDLTDFANKAVSLYENKKVWENMQSQCADFLTQRFNYSEHSQNLMSRVNGLINQLDAHRLNNFTGSMLRHHLMKSTQYMSQWIEVKNQLAEKDEV